MSTKKPTFTLAQANELLPKLKRMLLAANKELDQKANILADAYAQHERCEQEMDKVKAVKTPGQIDQSSENIPNFDRLRKCRLNFQTSIEGLYQAKQSYLETLNYWLEEISQTGVILRDIKSGLLDFPAQSGEFEYHLCWQAHEEDVQYWHMVNDGFMGRRPLTVLSEYS